MTEIEKPAGTGGEAIPEVDFDMSLLDEMSDVLDAADEGSRGAIFRHRPSSLSNYMDTTDGIDEIETGLPSREQVRVGPATTPRDEERRKAKERQHALRPLIDIRPVIEMTVTPERGSEIEFGFERDSNGEVVSSLGNVSKADIDLIRDEIVEKIPDVLKGFQPFNPDLKKLALIYQQLNSILKGGSGSNLNRVSPTPSNMQAIVNEIIGLGPLSALAADPEVSDIIVAAHDRIFVEKKGKMYRVTNVGFESVEQLKQFVERIVGIERRGITTAKPVLDMNLSDGSRVNIIGPPLTDDGEYLMTIRRFKKQRFTLDDLLGFGTLNEEMLYYLDSGIKSYANILLSGGTGAGKTATLEAFAAAKPLDESVVTAEDTRELKLPRANWRAMTIRPSESKEVENIDMRRLVKTTLRMRPDSIVVGETRDATAYDILVAMNSGHNGSMTTVHANDSVAALRKFEMLAMQADERPPSEVLREMVCECFDIVVSVNRMKVSGDRRITSIDEVVGYDAVKNTYEVRNVFRYVPIGKGPDGKMEYRFMRNPDYYTSKSLAFKLEEAGYPPVPHPDGETDNRFEGMNISERIVEMEREAERAHDTEMRVAEESRRRAIQETVREREKARRKAEAAERRRQAAAKRAEGRVARHQADLDRKAEERKERGVARDAERRKRREDAKAQQRRRGMEHEIASNQDKRTRESIAGHINAEASRKESDELGRLLAAGMSVEDAKIAAGLSADALRSEMEARYRKLTPWQARNVGRAEGLYAMLDEGLDFQGIADARGMSMNSVLKYMRIIDADMVNAYCTMQKLVSEPATAGDGPSGDESAEPIEAPQPHAEVVPDDSDPRVDTAVDRVQVLPDWLMPETAVGEGLEAAADEGTMTRFTVSEEDFLEE